MALLQAPQAHLSQPHGLLSVPERFGGCLGASALAVLGTLQPAVLHAAPYSSLRPRTAVSERPSSCTGSHGTHLKRHLSLCGRILTYCLHSPPFPGLIVYIHMPC